MLLDSDFTFIAIIFSRCISDGDLDFNTIKDEKDISKWLKETIKS